MTEIQRKLTLLRTCMQKEKLAAVHLRGVDWFSWVTAGASSTVILTAEIGVAEVLITLDRAWVLTNRIETQRLREEEITGEFEITDFAWQDPLALRSFILEKVANGAVAADRPLDFERALPTSIAKLKLSLQPEEIARYREIGLSSAEAMTDALLLAKPDWTEYQVAAAGAQALWLRGLEPTLILVAGHGRCAKYRHPIATDAPIGESAMMVFCARKFGLYANLTRFIYFRALSETEKSNFSTLEKIEQAAFAATRVGETLASVYQHLDQAYKTYGREEQIDLHHQGGPTGYLSRETVASPLLANDIAIETGMAFAWNPSLPGAKIEDTAILTEEGLEILTCDPRWPSSMVGGRVRPAVMVKT